MESSTGLLIVGGVVAIALAVIALLIPMLFRRIVPANEVHVVQNGKNTVPYGQQTTNGNVYYKWPTWIPVIGVEVKSLSVSIFNIELDGYDAFDKGRLPFLVDVMAFFRISDYATASQRVSSNQHLVEQLTSIVQGSVRSIIAKSDIEEVMEERSVLGDKFTEEVKEQLKAWGIEAVKNIELMDIKDAPKSEIIHNIMAKKKSHIEMESRLEVAKNNKLADIAEVEAKREVDLGKQEAAQTVGLRTVAAKQSVEMAEETKKQAIMEQTKLTTERELDVQKIRDTKAAEIEKEVALVEANRKKEVEIVEAEKQKQVALINSNKNKESSLIDADKDFQVKTRNADAAAKVRTTEADANLEAQTKLAQANLEIATKEAQGIEAKGLASAKTKEADLMAPVNAQIALADKIGKDKEYQEYLLKIEQIKANQEVGIAQAEALGQADIKVIANGGTVDQGIQSIPELFTAKGGTQLGLLLEGLKNTEMGKALLDKVGVQ